jgi:hypothetical protein
MKVSIGPEFEPFSSPYLILAGKLGFGFKIQPLQKREVGRILIKATLYCQLSLRCQTE